MPYVEEMQKYTGQGLNDYAYLTSNETEQIYTIVDIADIHGRRVIGVVLVVRVIADRIVIELDHHNKMLFDVLIARDVPANQIVWAYMGEPLPV